MDADEIRTVIARVLGGDSQAFALLLREFGLPVRAFIHSRVQVKADAEDLAQETFIAAFRGLKKFQPEHSFEAWLIGIARHRVQAHFRASSRGSAMERKFREECLAKIDAELETAERLRSEEQLARLMECVEKLPERMRMVVRARLREEQGEQTAARMGTSRGAVYMLQLRANGLLRQCMNRQTA